MADYLLPLCFYPVETLLLGLIRKLILFVGKDIRYRYIFNTNEKEKMDNKTKIIMVIAICVILSGFLSYQYVTDVTALNSVEVTIDDIKLQELRLTYCKLKLSFDIYNPTHQDISGLSAVFDVFIAGNYVGSGSFPKSSLPAQSNSKKYVTLTI